MKYKLFIFSLLVSIVTHSQTNIFLKIRNDSIFIVKATGVDSIYTHVPENFILNYGFSYATSILGWDTVKYNLRDEMLAKADTNTKVETPHKVKLKTDSLATALAASIAATYLPKTSTSNIGTSPTSSSTVTITHNLGRVPTIIRIYGYGTFTSNAAATATTSSMGVWNSSGNRCVYQRYGAAITTTQAGLSSNTFSILLATGGGSFISGVIQNVTSTQFDIVWTETGTATAQVYLWECQ